MDNLEKKSLFGAAGKKQKLYSVIAGVAAGKTFDAPNKFETTSHFRLFGVENAMKFYVEKTRRNGLAHNLLIVEMSLHIPRAIGKHYSENRFWVALPHDESANTDVNYVTAALLYQAMMNENMYNCAIATGTKGRMLVPNLGWDNADLTTDGDFDQYQAKLVDAKKLVMSDIYIIYPDGFEPDFTPDHTDTGWAEEQGDYDYHAILNNYAMSEDEGGIGKPLAYIPCLNSISGYGIISHEPNKEQFYTESNIQVSTDSGAGENNRGTDIYKCFYTLGHIFNNSMANSVPHPIAFNWDDNSVWKEGDTSRSLGVENRVLPNKLLEFSYRGTMIVQQFPKSSAIAMRICVDQFTIIEH